MALVNERGRFAAQSANTRQLHVECLAASTEDDVANGWLRWLTKQMSRTLVGQYALTRTCRRSCVGAIISVGIWRSRYTLHAVK